MNPSTTPSRLAWLGLAGALALPAGVSAGDKPDGSGQCVNVPPALVVQPQDPPEAAPEGQIWPDLTGTPIHPGETLPTFGTTRRISTELKSKLLVVDQETSFSFTTSNGPVTGVFRERVYSSTSDCNCKSHLQIEVKLGCVARVLIQKFNHPLGLDIVADYRTDLDPKGVVPSKTVSRSTVAQDNGATFGFSFPKGKPVCAGQASRWLLLNTSIDHVSEEQQSVQFVAPNGQASGFYRFHVPVSAP